jgi:hypothetical protein
MERYRLWVSGSCPAMFSDTVFSDT